MTVYWEKVVPYCPEQAPMGAHSSSVKIWGWAVTWRTRLNGSTIPMQGPTQDAKLAAMGLNGLGSSVRQLFVEASPTVEKAASCYKADRLVASLLSFRSIQSSLAVRKFHAAGEEHCKRGHGRVCVNLWCLMSCRSADLRTFGFTTREFSMVGGYTENLEKPQNCQNRGWALAGYGRLLGTIR